MKKRIIGLMIIVASILMVPLIAMQFTNGVDWNITDFIAAGILLFGTGLIYELGIRRIKSKNYRVALGIVLFLALFITWAELAVGIFGTPFAGS